MNCYQQVYPRHRGTPGASCGLTLPRRLATFAVAVLACLGASGLLVLTQACSASPPVDQGPVAGQATVGRAIPFSVSFSGSVSGLLAIDTVNNCGPEQNVPGYVVDAVGRINGASYDFTVQIPQYRGPGTYSTTGVGATAALSLSSTQQAQTWSSASDQGGSVAVQSDGQAGTINSTLADDGGRQTQVTGTWSCG